jgi:hypothetical protein
MDDDLNKRALQFVIILFSALIFLGILIINVPSVSEELDSMPADKDRSTESTSSIDYGRVRVCGGLITSINRSWQVAVKPGQRPLASFKAMAPIAAWSATKKAVGDQQDTYLAAVAPHDAFWLGFEVEEGLFFAVTIDVDGRNALTGHKGWSRALELEPKNFLLIPDQPWLDAMVGQEGRLQQLIPRFDHEARPIGFASGGEIRLVIYPIEAGALEPPLLQQPKGPVPQYAKEGAASQNEPTIHPWLGRNMRRNVQAPRPCARLTFHIVEPKLFETLTALHLPEGMFDDVDSTPPPPFELF